MSKIVEWDKKNNTPNVDTGDLLSDGDDIFLVLANNDEGIVTLNRNSLDTEHYTFEDFYHGFCGYSIVGKCKLYLENMFDY